MLKEKYSIKINNFEGPMDLLLYFINRDRIDIYDIPIFKITEDYLNHLNLMKEMDIDLGAEFIFMSTLLIQIKARMLLPKTVNEEEVEIEDPRAELVHRLLEYKRFKAISDELSEKLSKHSKKYPKGSQMNYELSIDVSNILSKEVNLFDIARTFKNIIENLPENNELDVVVEQISLQDQLEFIREILLNKKKFYLSKMIIGSSRVYVVSLFLAILELIRIHEIKFKQIKNFSDIIITRVR